MARVAIMLELARAVRIQSPHSLLVSQSAIGR
jgi:hypothetical protein